MAFYFSFCFWKIDGFGNIFLRFLVCHSKFGILIPSVNFWRIFERWHIFVQNHVFVHKLVWSSFCGKFIKIVEKLKSAETSAIWKANSELLLLWIHQIQILYWLGSGNQFFQKLFALVCTGYDSLNIRSYGTPFIWILCGTSQRILSIFFENV